MRRANSCMMGGCLVAAPVALVAAFPHRQPHGTLITAVVFIWIIGIMVLVDEVNRN